MGREKRTPKLWTYGKRSVCALQISTVTVLLELYARKFEIDEESVVPDYLV